MTDKKQEIKRCGKELFILKGYKDTNITDITRMAGMAAGTFYLYYPSKDSLFMEIFLEENVKLKRSIMEAVDTGGDPADVIKQITYLNNKGIKEHPILNQWYDKDVFEKIERKYREEKGLERLDFMYDSYAEVIRKWQAEGKMRNDIDCEMIMAIFAAIINIDAHKQEVGLQYFPQLMEYVVEFVMKGLTADA